MSQFYNQTRDTIVSFKEQGEEILGQLVRGTKEREAVLITGMSGLGKTTLAKRLYDEEVVRQHFDIRAWCTVSQEYDYKDSIRKMCKEVFNSTTFQGGDDDEVAERLRQRLMGMRYLVVLDDIWSTKAWEELHRVLPSCDNGSRILLTSRQEDVVVARGSHRLPFFTRDESWELLQMKLFGEGGEECPEKLASVGKKISDKCGGLPLVVGLVAGLLRRIEREEKAWCGFLDDLSSKLRDENRSNEAIELSYKHLPHRLKQCLLYFAAYPEDKPIEVSQLMGLWIAEGFVETTDDEETMTNVEDVAEDYLNNLVVSNLVLK